MKTPNLVGLVLALGAATLLAAAGQADELYGAPPPDLKRHLDRLVAAYPDWIAGHDETHLIMKDGTKFVISDLLANKSFDTLLEKPDIDDMFYAPYPKGSAPAPPGRNVDPGRVRFQSLFVKMYGDCKKRDLAGSLRSIEWLPRHKGGRVLVTTVNGVDKALERVSRELDALPADLIKYAKPSAGTYACRTIAGSNVRSMHAYANAIDLNTEYSAYWRWPGGANGAPKWRNQIPVEIVRVFEKHGFIWGGYWYHYDTMHFEYRPELLGP
jgi:hypothetical protein